MLTWVKIKQVLEDNQLRESGRVPLLGKHRVNEATLVAMECDENHGGATELSFEVLRKKHPFTILFTDSFEGRYAPMDPPTVQPAVLSGDAIYRSTQFALGGSRFGRKYTFRDPSGISPELTVCRLAYTERPKVSLDGLPIPNGPSVKLGWEGGNLRTAVGVLIDPTLTFRIRGGREAIPRLAMEASEDLPPELSVDYRLIEDWLSDTHGATDILDAARRWVLESDGRPPPPAPDLVGPVAVLRNYGPTAAGRLSALAAQLLVQQPARSRLYDVRMHPAEEDHPLLLEEGQIQTIDLIFNYEPSPWMPMWIEVTDNETGQVADLDPFALTVTQTEVRLSDMEGHSARLPLPRRDDFNSHY